LRRRKQNSDGTPQSPRLKQSVCFLQPSNRLLRIG
jgi:hypothetical protein